MEREREAGRGGGGSEHVGGLEVLDWKFWEGILFTTGIGRGAGFCDSLGCGQIVFFFFLCLLDPRGLFNCRRGKCGFCSWNSFFFFFFFFFVFVR